VDPRRPPRPPCRHCAAAGRPLRPWRLAFLCGVLAAALAGPAPARASGSPAAAPPPAPPAVRAEAAALLDPGTGRFLYAKAADLPLPVASLEKIMTVRLALRHPASTKITARADVLAAPPTRAGLVPGRTYLLGDLLPVLVVHSANDVAVADGLAGSVRAFADQMNAEAAALGLRDTRFVNPSGLDAPGQHSSARDIALLSAAAMRDPGFRRLVGLRSAALPGGPAYRSVNPFLWAYPGADGIKTGFTDDAGFCLAASAARGNRRLIAVVLREPSFAAADREAAALLDWGFARLGPQPPPAAAGAETAASGTAVRAAGSLQPALTPPPDTAPPAPAPAAGPPQGDALRRRASPTVRPWAARPRPPQAIRDARTPAVPRTLAMATLALAAPAAVAAALLGRRRRRPGAGRPEQPRRTGS
jgi:D-alanyl-D-alanine carboxypeptidase